MRFVPLSCLIQLSIHSICVFVCYVCLSVHVFHTHTVCMHFISFSSFIRWVLNYISTYKLNLNFDFCSVNRTCFVQQQNLTECNLTVEMNTFISKLLNNGSDFNLNSFDFPSKQQNKQQIISPNQVYKI